jgi:hypothetical protein
MASSGRRLPSAGVSAVAAAAARRRSTPQLTKGFRRTKEFALCCRSTMSYDLMFTPAPGQPVMMLTQFFDYFSARANYEVNGQQAWYVNDDTGVYFSFEYDAQTEEPSDWRETAENGDEWVPTVATFNLNFNRPSFFALEAAVELEAFVSEFHLGIDDPQAGGMGRGPFVRERFVAGWTAANEWACSVVRDETTPPPLTYPRDRLDKIWRWNYQRKALQEKLGESIFVPRLSFAVVEGVAQTFVVWPDAMASYVPEVDIVVLVREQLATWRWFRRSPQMLLAPWRAVADAVARYPVALGPIPHVQIDYGAPPSDVIQFVQRKWPRATKTNFAAVSPDTVLDAEYFETTAA